LAQVVAIVALVWSITLRLRRRASRNLPIAQRIYLWAV
jgi:hypothetical protein